MAWSRRRCQSAVSEIEQRTRGYRAPVSGESDRSQPSPDDPPGGVLDEAAVHPTQGGGEEAALRAALHRRGYPPAGVGRCRPRGSIGARGPAHFAAGVTVFGKPEFENLAGIGIHIYNFRESKTYASVRVHMTTQARRVSIGERRKPDPRGRPGYLRVDTVHRVTGRQKGVYHINAVDTVTQWQVVGCVETICESCSGLEASASFFSAF